MLRLIVFLFLLLPSVLSAKILSVKDEKAQLLAGPGKNFSIKFELERQFPLRILSAKGNWLRVEDFESDSGWILKGALIDHPTVIVKANKDTDNKVNIRSGPGETFRVVGQAFYGVVFEKLEHQNGWVKVHHDSGLTGWVKGSFLWGY